MRFINQIIPIFIAGILIAMTAFGLVLLAYLIFLLSCIGGVIYLFKQLQSKFAHKSQKPSQPSGRIIDSDEWHKL